MKQYLSAAPVTWKQSFHGQMFKGGKVAEQIVGYVPKDTIDKSIVKVLA